MKTRLSSEISERMIMIEDGFHSDFEKVGNPYRLSGRMPQISLQPVLLNSPLGAAGRYGLSSVPA